MKREHIAGIATVLVLVGILVVLGARNAGKAAGTDDPKVVVFDLFRRAEAGDVDGYLSCFGPGLRTTVEASRRDMGGDAFREHIRAIGKAVKGVSVQVDRADSREARLRVELVYADRSHNDVQTFAVSKAGSRWLISSMSQAERVKMPIPYGTPAYPLELDAEPEAGTEAPAGASQGGRQPADSP
jgi:hypothetical protein